MIVQQVRRQIEQELQATRTEVERLDELLKLKGDYGLGRGDPTVYSWERNLARRERAKVKLEKLEAALQRIEEGTYGVCEACGQAIEPERLAALPIATLCIACAHQGAQPQLSTAIERLSHVG
ncbi:MAG: TraR/DksA family transcriptional regulator [Anaerolineae bacterium]|nr:TraR/DksA family transcriptional regulator [Anaerolineae bacterium]